jgi:hypothetical protein
MLVFVKMNGYVSTPEGIEALLAQGLRPAGRQEVQYALSQGDNEKNTCMVFARQEDWQTSCPKKSTPEWEPTPSTTCPVLYRVWMQNPQPREIREMTVVGQVWFDPIFVGVKDD